MNDTVEYYQKLILEKLYDGFMSNPAYRIANEDTARVFSNVKDETSFNIAREQLTSFNIAREQLHRYYL